MHLPLHSNAYGDVTDLQFVDLTKIQKSGYLEYETLFFLQIKKSINYTLRATFMVKNSFAEEVTFNAYNFLRTFDLM